MLSLLAANLLAIAIAVHLSLRPFSLAFLFAIQTAIICLSQAVRILKVRNFDPGLQLRDSKHPRLAAAWFVVWFYGFIHLIIFALLVMTAWQEKIPLPSPTVVATCSAAFLFAQVMALSRGLAMDAAGRPALLTLVFLPGPRVLALHCTMVFGIFMMTGGTGLALIGGLKTLADVVMYVVEHELLASRA